MPRPVCYSLLLLTLSLLPLTGNLQAQHPFERSAVGIEGAADLNRTMLNDYWQQRTGFTLFWATPFYLGEIELRASLLPLSARQDGQPDLNNVLTTLSWGLPLSLTDRVTLSGSLHLGNNFLYRVEAGPLEGPESEFSAGFAVQLRYRLSERVTLRSGVQHTRVFTFHRMDLTYAGFGLEYHLNTPKWLVRFLR